MGGGGELRKGRCSQGAEGTRGLPLRGQQGQPQKPPVHPRLGGIWLQAGDWCWGS